VQRYTLKRVHTHALAGAALLLSVAGAGAQPRTDFLAAEKAIARGDAAQVRKHLRRLADHPLAPYLEIAWARRRLAALSHEEVSALLARHEEIPVAFRLRRDWMRRLVREKRWTLIIAHHRAGGDTASECTYAEALWRDAREQEAWRLVAALWLTGSSLPDRCDPVLAGWRSAGALDVGLAWERAALAVEAGNLRLAHYLARFLAARDTALLEHWMALRRRPAGLAAFAAKGDVRTPRRRRVMLDVMDRAARRDAQRAAELLRSLPRERLGEGLHARLRASVGAALARNGEDPDLDWLDGAASPTELAWGAVSAMRSARWQQVLEAVASMPREEAARERWRYWGAHARDALGLAEGMQAMRELATERSYYGFLAADRSGQAYRLGHSALQVNEASLRRLEELPALRRVKAWLALGRDTEARREWQYLLARLEPERLEGAAVLADRWGWHEAAIRAAAAARSWDDLELRFPIAHRREVSLAVKRSKLPASRIYAVVRQESAFMRDVRSPAGALGLMQLMPATARQVARRAGVRRPRTRDLLDPARNLMLGSLYLSRLERRYAGHAVLASAAYNAGPRRVARWRPRAAAMDARTWVETIAFRETRRYVRRVLTYQVIYAQRLGETPLTLRELMPEVSPRRP
jgi:soluble lytic murein transglycosylase